MGSERVFTVNEMNEYSMHKHIAEEVVRNQ